MSYNYGNKVSGKIYFPDYRTSVEPSNSANKSQTLSRIQATANTPLAQFRNQVHSELQCALTRQKSKMLNNCNLSAIRQGKQLIIRAESFFEAREVFGQLVLNVQTLHGLSKEERIYTIVNIRAHIDALIDYTNNTLDKVTKEEQRIKKLLLDTEKAFGEACTKRDDDYSQMIEFSNQLEGLNSKMKELSQTISNLNSEVAKLDQEIEEEKTRRTDALIDLIPLAGQIGGLITGRYERMIPFYSQVRGIISVAHQTKEIASFNLALKSGERLKFRSEATSVSTKITEKKGKVEKLDQEIKNLDTKKTTLDQSIKGIGKELTGVKGTNSSLGKLLDNYTFLNMDVDALETFVEIGMLEEEEITKLCNEIQSIQLSFGSISGLLKY